jgi:hypothetical protein
MTGDSQQGGLLRFIKVDGVTYVIAAPMSAEPDKGMHVPYAKVTATGSVLSWKFLTDRDNTTDSAAVRVSDFGSTLMGESVCLMPWAPKSGDILNYSWVAELVSADLLKSSPDMVKRVYSSLGGFSEESFAEALQLNPRSAGTMHLPFIEDLAALDVPIVPLPQVVKVELPPLLRK